jgi:hypothetical protein
MHSSLISRQIFCCKHVARPLLAALVLFSAVAAASAHEPAAPANDIAQLVGQTHAASLQLREQALRRTIARDSCWPGGAWGETLWALSALYLNEKTDEANARLLQRAQNYITRNRAHVEPSAFIPEQADDTPWAYFSLTDYVRTVYLFRAQSPHFPGRLKPETEAAMKEALWYWVSKDSRLADAGLDDLFLLLGTENHDLSRRPNHYLISALLQDDPAYKQRKLADGHTLAEHAAAYTTYFREWPRARVKSGLWAEVGSNTYQKYSWPALFNLHELAPDPVIRKRFGLVLDLAFIEEAQISVRGRRGGGRSRAEYGANGFESYQNLLFASEGRPAGSSHSRVTETCRYQLPAAAILLQQPTLPVTNPFVIRNRVLGELEMPQSQDEGGQRLAADSALVNNAYRTPHYLLGSTLQNPTLNYSGISRQKRACGLLFDNPAAKEISEVHPEVEHTGGGRSQHSFWTVQHENVLLLQRIARVGRSASGSYNTGKVGIRFRGKELQQLEQAGWIFASNGKAFVGVQFLDGGHDWDDAREVANPATFTGPSDTTRILLHAGDLISHNSFADFCEDLLNNPLKVTAEKVEYRFGPGTQRIEMHLYNAAAPAGFHPPLINGTPVDLRPETIYQSPFLKGTVKSDRITVTVGPISQVLDFSDQVE